MTPSYFDTYRNIAFRRDDGLLEIRVHSDDGPLVFDHRAHRDLGEALAQIAADRDNRVVIVSGTGDDFCTRIDMASFMGEDLTAQRIDAERLLRAFLDIDVPVIAVVNGPAHIHSELPLLADVVLCAEHATFRDGQHFVQGVVPGDGMNLVWTTLLGLNRGRHFLLSGATIDAREALSLGVVAEVLPAERLQPRARELAEAWLDKPDAVLRGTRRTLIAEWKRIFDEHFVHGLDQEFAAIEAAFGRGGDAA